MDTLVNLTDREIAELKEFTNETSLSDAVRTAMREYVCYARRLRLLKKFSGRIEFLDKASELDGAAP